MDGEATGPTEPMEAKTSAPPERMIVVRLDGCEAGDCDPLAEALEQFTPLAEALEQFTPLAEALRPGLHAFGARGPSRYFGGEPALAGLVARAAAEAVPSASKVGVGAADGLFAAGLAARMAPRMPAAPTARPTAVEGHNTRPPRAGQHDTGPRRAGQHDTGLPGVGLPDSAAVLVVPTRRNRAFLAGLPLTLLADPVSPLSSDDATEALIDVLWRLGMRTLADVAELSEADMVGRFGWPGLLAHRLACGLDDRPLQARPAPEDSGAEAEIDPPADRVETVAFMARALADDMVGRLARNGLDCVSVGIEAESDSGHASRRRWRHELRFAAADIVDRVRWQLEGWYRSHERPTGPVTLIRLTPCEVAPADGRQLGMWGEKSEADERAARALARLQGLLGPEAVTVPRLAVGRRPADIGRRVPLHATADRPASDSGPSTASAEGKQARATEGAVTSATKAKPSAATPAPARTASPAAGKTKATRKARKAKSAEAAVAPWPGRLPPPQPAVVPARPEPITVTDRDGAAVTVSGRGEASAAPWQVTSQDGKARRVTAWAGPWPLDERWWRPAVRRRQARFQLVLDDGSAHLCVLESGRWHREATYD